MAERPRKSGIDAIGDITWGTHFCHFYQTKQDLLDILVPYFKAGLKNREYCTWLVFDPLSIEEAKTALRAALHDFDRHLEAGDIEILPHLKWYLRDGVFDLHRVIHGWQEKLAQALEKGYAGLRVNGNEAWLTEKEWKNFAAYEQKLNELIADKKMIVMCTYPLTLTKAAELFDVARTHQFAVVRNRGNWEAIETPELIQTKGEIRRLNEELEQRVIDRTSQLAKANEELSKEIETRKQAEIALKKSEGELRSLFAALVDVVLVLDFDGCYLKIAPTNPVNLYRPTADLIGRTVHDVLPAEQANEILQQIKRSLENHQTINYEYKLNIDSREIWFESRISPLTHNTVFWVARDITERKRIEDDLKRQKEILQTIFDHLPVMINFFGQDGLLQMVNREWVRTFGWSLEEIRKQNLDILAECYPDARIRQQVHDFISSPTTEWANFKTRVRDGRVIDTTWVMVHLLDGTAIGMGLDITERKQAEEAQFKLTAQLAQAQKMESVGRLAGGVAHDYNNALSVILGYTEMALDRVAPDDPLHDDLKEILEAVRRSAEITRQLLAFARKQSIAPKVLDLNETVEGMLKMLRRLIGEDIDLVWMPKAGLWPVKMDPSQVDQILANLCVNARDAIAGVGKIIIETHNINLDQQFCFNHVGCVPGDYALLMVSDNGSGMDQETLANIFEPFFTTKELGKGTGLGLSTVFGIVKQNGGIIYVDSEPGKGTIFKIYLPRHEGEIEKVEVESAAEIPIGHGETVFLVEDDPAIMTMAMKILIKLGYRVLAAGRPGEAIQLAEDHTGQIHLLITDVIMPEMNGPELAGRLRSIFPDIRVLFVSGYTADVIAHHGVLDKEVHFIQKPYTTRTIAAKVRTILNRKSMQS